MAGPLHIDSGDVRTIVFCVTVVDEVPSERPRKPIVLVRPCHEYNCAHYDLVSSKRARETWGAGDSMPAVTRCVTRLALPLQVHFAQEAGSQATARTESVRGAAYGRVSSSAAT